MTREQDLITAFTLAISDLGIDEMKKTLMFVRGSEEELPDYRETFVSSISKEDWYSMDEREVNILVTDED